MKSSLNPGYTSRTRAAGLPPTTKQRVVVRAAAAGAGNNIISASDWRVVTQASPSSVPASMPSQIFAYSNLEDSYDSTTNGLKTIVKFGAQSLAAGESAILRFGSDVITHESVTGTFDIPASANGFAANIKLRVRPITADFDATAVTWDNTVVAPSLTFGTAEVRDVLGETQSQTPSDAQIRAVKIRLSLGIQLTGALTFYGVMIDIQPNQNTATFNSASAQWSSTLTSAPDDAPYMILF